MDPLTLAVVALAGMCGGGGLVWLVMTMRHLRRDLDEARTKPPMPRWAEDLRLDHRAQLLSVAALVRLAARDNLDALIRVSPEMADDVLRELAPHLFNRKDIK